MKNLARFLLPIVILGSTNLVGCKNKEDKRTLLSFGDVHTDGYKSITVDELSNAIINKESFIVVINTETCGCWDKFEPNLAKYVKDNKLLCYKVSANDFLHLPMNNRYGLSEVTSSTITFAIFEQGNLKQSLNTNKNSDIMYEYKNFEKYMNETIVLPKAFFIEKDDVNIIKESGKNAIIYFERNGCGDCNTLNPTILYSYIKNNPSMNNIYVLDCQDYYRKSTDPYFENYVAFKNEMGMAIENNPVYGFGSGVFPFFSFIENKEYKSGCVIYNDELETVDGKTTIKNSYYTTERNEVLDYTDVVLQGKEIPESELQTNAYGFKSWSYEFQNKCYEGILKSFLDAKLPLVNFIF